MEINFEEILNKHKNFQKSTVMMDDSYVAQRVAISAMKEVWNKAIEAASKNADADYVYHGDSERDGIEVYVINSSILKLKV